MHVKTIAAFFGLVAAVAALPGRHSAFRERHQSRRRAGLHTGSGHLTFYYDINGAGTCGAINGIQSYAETSGVAMCEPWTNPKTLKQRGSNRVVAIPYNMLVGNTEKYCGKEVSIHWKGKLIDNLIVWDGCASCSDNGGIDVSSSMFGDILGVADCALGRVDDVKWQILDRQIWNLNGEPVNGDEKPPKKPTKTKTALIDATISVKATNKIEKPVAASKEEKKTTKSTKLNFATPVNAKLAVSAKVTGKVTATKTKKSTKTSTVKATSKPKTSSKIRYECSDRPGEWRCAGNRIEQCIQVPGGWQWSSRLECSVKPVNCDTAVPVCPGSATT